MTRDNRMSVGSPILPYAALISAMLVWGSSFIALKVSFRYFDPFFVILARQIIAALVFLPLVRKHFKTVRKQDIKWMILMAFFEPCLYFIFEAKSLTLTTAGQAGMVTAMLPLLVALPSALILKESISKKTITGFLTATLGVVWLSLVSSPEPEAPNPALGNFLEFLAMVSASGYMIIIKKLSSRYSSFFLTAIQAFMGSIFFFPFIFIIPSPQAGAFTLGSVLILIYLGIAVTIGAYGSYNYGISRIPASQSAAFINLIPVITLILSMIFLNERLTFYQYIASALVLFGVIFSQDRRSSPAEKISLY